MLEEKKEAYRRIVEGMINLAFELDKEGYALRRENRYRAKKYFNAANKLREIANYIDAFLLYGVI